VRVFSHLSVRDQSDEIARALAWSADYDLVVVTGGLGPTSDDLTRACVAAYAGVPLEFDQAVWTALEKQYATRGLPLREAHRHQCFFPVDAQRLANPVGTALGFHLNLKGRPFYVLPGPPRELEAMWLQEVEPHLHAEPRTREWVRWTCLGAPESEVAELVEAAIAGCDLEVGYRAQIPYVKVKLYADPMKDAAVLQEVDRVLAPFVVARGEEDLAEELLRQWPTPQLHVCDAVTDGNLIARLLSARKLSGGPKLSFDSQAAADGLNVHARGEEFFVDVGAQKGAGKTLPYQVKLDSERGRRSVTEWALWLALSALRRQSSTSGL
jgi:molybdopterin-biosynthesis enzyme MoeA-like protein